MVFVQSSSSNDDSSGETRLPQAAALIDVATSGQKIPFRAANAPLSQTFEPRLLGSGAYGRVYLLEPKSRKATPAARLLVAKAMLDVYGEITRTARKEAEREVRNLIVACSTRSGKLRCHPNVVGYVDHFVGRVTAHDPIGDIIVLKYVAGVSMRQYVKSTLAGWPPAENVALDIATSAALGLDFLHSKHIVHGDIKPENIMIARQGDRYQAVLVDLGQACFQSVCRRVGGSTAFLAPEIDDAKREQRLATLMVADVYALGVALFILLRGHYPHQISNGRPFHVFQRKMPASPFASTDPEDIYAACPALARIVLRMVSLNAAQRPATNQVLQQLQRIRSR